VFKRTITCGISALALGFAANAYARDMPPLQGPTADFVTKAAQSDEFERREGRMAALHGHSMTVKKFGMEMVTAHSKTTMALKSAIHHAHMAPPPKPDLTGPQTQMMADLKGLHGAAFDKAYIDQQVKAHEETLGVMQGYAQGGEPGPIRDAAQKTVPLVQHHLDMAKDIQGKLGA
jgi:putative membrane protein